MDSVDGGQGMGVVGGDGDDGNGDGEDGGRVQSTEMRM